MPERALILFAGGRATRLGGVNKGLLEVGGRPIVARILDEIGPLVTDRVALAVALASDPALANDPALADLPSLRLVLDPQPHAGVLPALANGLAAATADVCLAVAFDMPFASRAVFERLLALQVEHDADVVLPRAGGHLEPMHAVYRRQPVLRAIRSALARGEQRMVAYFSAVRVVEVPAEPDLRGLGPAGLSGVSPFFNVNTPDDLAEARRLAGGGRAAAG